MARCPVCESEIRHVVAEKLELTGAEDFVGEAGPREGHAIATLCPECDAIIGI